jgi:hypothetical protein
MRHASLRVGRLGTRAFLLCIAWAVALLAAPRDAHGQATGDDSVLARHGRLKVQTGAIHGPSPLVLLLTEAPASASAPERRYRARFTEQLTQYLELHSFSYYVFRDSLDRDSLAGTPRRTVDRLEVAALQVVAALTRKRLAPVAYIGLADGAVISARIAATGSSVRGLAALSPSLPSEGGVRTVRWDEVIRAMTPRRPLLFAVQSACDGPMPGGLLEATPWNQRLLILPDHDSWLAPLLGPSCPGEGQAQERIQSMQVAPMVVEWLGSWVTFPT